MSKFSADEIKNIKINTKSYTFKIERIEHGDILSTEIIDVNTEV